MQHVLFNKTNINHFMWLENKEILEIHVKDRNMALVTYKHGNTTKKAKVTRIDIMDAIVQNRQKRSKNIKITNNYDGTYTAENPIKETQYTIKPYFKKITCTCPDWANLSIALETDEVACKHVFAYLNTLGFSNLQEYISEMKYYSSQEAEEFDEYLHRLEYETLAYSDVDLHVIN